MPIGTNVEIISQGNIHNGKRGAFRSKTQDGLVVQFDNGESDYFKDDEVVPIQNIIMIDNLEYETLCKVFEHSYIYDADRIIVKQKKFAYEEIDTALEEYTALLAKVFSKDSDFGEEGICLDNRGKVLELLNLMADDDYEEYNKFSTAIEEVIMYEQWWVEGFRKHLMWNGKDEKPLRYFNSKAKIETIFI